MSAIPSKADVVVIGAGPAGCLAAAYMAMEGIDVVQLDKAKSPRPNVGESLIPHFWKYTDLIGATPAIIDEGFVVKNGGLVLWNGVMRQARFKDFGYDQPGLHVERGRFDQILLETARARGANAFEEVTATRIDPDDDPCVVAYRTKDGTEGTIQCRFVVDASGQAAVLAKQRGVRQFDPDIRFMSLWGYYVGGRYLSVDGSVHPFEKRYDVPPATVVSTIGDWGWVWQIVQKKEVSMGVILPPERLRDFKAGDGSREAKFQRIIEETPLTGDLMHGAEYKGGLNGIRDYAYAPRELAIGRCFLAGDAAAFVDPINSAGVVFGMFAGFLSGWAIKCSLNNPADTQRYRDLYCKLYGDRLGLFRLLAMPSDAQGLDDALNRVGHVVRSSSRAEQELMLLQATLCQRPEGVSEAFRRHGVDLAVDPTVVPVPEPAVARGEQSVTAA